jgi:hypothetical protein
MTELSIAQEYLLCSLNEKGKLPMISTEVPACILAGGLIELMVSGCIRIEGKTVQIAGEPAGDQVYLKSLYDFISQAKQATLEKIAREYCLSFTGKRMNMLVTDIGNSLAGAGCVTSLAGGFLAGKPSFVPNPEAVDKVIQKIRAEMLESGAMTDETVALVSLLEKSSRIKRYFSGYEAGQLNARLKEIRETSPNRMIRQMMEYIDSMIAVIAVIAAAH